MNHLWIKIREVKPTLHLTWCCPNCGHRITTRNTKIKLDKLKKITPRCLLEHLKIPIDCKEANILNIMTG